MQVSQRVTVLVHVKGSRLRKIGLCVRAGRVGQPITRPSQFARVPECRGLLKVNRSACDRSKVRRASGRKDLLRHYLRHSVRHVTAENVAASTNAAIRFMRYLLVSSELIVEPSNCKGGHSLGPRTAIVKVGGLVGSGFEGVLI
jgi:hypothetical protein